VAALCGVHCINTLLQGPYFSELDLAQVCQQMCSYGFGLQSAAHGSTAVSNMHTMHGCMYRRQQTVCMAWQRPSHMQRINWPYRLQQQKQVTVTYL
jgi:hypothetical protein